MDYVICTTLYELATDCMNNAATCNVAEQSLCALTHVSTEQLNKHYCHAVDTGRHAEACGPLRSAAFRRFSWS